jgi:[ribosomal protein S18]-alanine N-acetyltransferase
MTTSRFDIKQLQSDHDLSTCAALMLRSNPWDKLYFTKEQCESDLLRPEMRVHGAVQSDGSILGFVASVENGIGFEPMIEYLCVEQQVRGTGIGSSLIRYFEEVLFPKADNLYLFVSDINPNAIRLYVRLGYLQVGAFPNFNLETQTEFLHRKTRRPRQARYITQ